MSDEKLLSELGDSIRRNKSRPDALIALFSAMTNCIAVATERETPGEQKLFQFAETATPTAEMQAQSGAVPLDKRAALMKWFNDHLQVCLDSECVVFGDDVWGCYQRGGAAEYAGAGFFKGLTVWVCAELERRAVSERMKRAFLVRLRGRETFRGKKRRVFFRGLKLKA